MEKVLYVVTKSNWGGAQRYVYDLATHLPKSTFEAVVACGPAQGSHAAGPLVERLTQAGIRTIVVPELTRDIGTSEWAAFSALLNCIQKEKPTVLHLNSSKAGIWGALAGRVAGVPRIIFTVHGWPFLERRSFVWRAAAWMGSILTLVLAHHVICVSENDRKHTPALLRRKTSTIHNAIPHNGLELDKVSAREKLIALGVPASHRTSAWFGIIAEHTATKDLSTALRAFALCLARTPEIPRLIVLIGDGEEHDSLVKLAHELGIGGSVFFTGFIPTAGQLIPAFDATLLTSQKEGLPYAILESLAYKVPVLASAVGGIPEIIHSHQNGLLCPAGDAECFSYAFDDYRQIPSLTTNPFLFEEMLKETLLHYRH